MPAPYKPRLHVVLFQPEIPHNTGSVGRTCVAVGAKLWLVRPLGFRLDAKHLRRSGLDYWRRLNWQTVNCWEELVQHLPVDRHWYFTKRGDKAYTDASFAEGDALVFGRESSGLPTEITAPADGRRLRMPMREDVRSLNLSNTVAVAAYEALRQWGGGVVD